MYECCSSLYVRPVKLKLKVVLTLMRRISVFVGAVGGRPDLLSNSTPPSSEPPSVSVEKYVKLFYMYYL